jgi:hypothetical protein
MPGCQSRVDRDDREESLRADIMVVFSVRRRRDINQGRGRSPPTDPMALTVPHGVRCSLTSRRDVGDDRLQKCSKWFEPLQGGWHADKPADDREDRQDRTAAIAA